VQSFSFNSLRSRYPVAIFAGLLLAAAFPNAGVAGFAWVAPGLMLASALGRNRAESFRLGYVAGLAYYLAALHWLLLIPYRWHGLPLGPAAGWLSLGAFLALYPAVWVWLVNPVHGSLFTHCISRFSRKLSGFTPRPSQTEAASPDSALRTPSSALPPSWLGRTLWALTGAAVWVALEMLIARFLSGFPWDLLGVSQYRLVPLIQIASVTGVYGLSFLVVWFSLSLVSAAVMVVRRPSGRSVWVAEVFIPTLVVALLFNLGFRQLRPQPHPGRTLKLTLIQPSIPQSLIWDSNADDQRFGDLVRLSEQALSNRTDILVWPEAAVPRMLRYDTNTFDAITGLARRYHVWMIVGSDDAEQRRGSADPNEADFYNSSFLISPEGKLAERYIKRNLVIFGEYIPLHNWLPFLKYFTPIQGGFTSGNRPGRFALPDLHAKCVVLICFEDIFPELARRDLEPDTDFLLNLTNDGWFGEGAAQSQQAATAIFRAVENRVPLVRCANNGLTCWVDAQGRLRETFCDDRRTIYGPGFITIEIPALAPGQTRPSTFYSRHGDWFGWICVAVAVLKLIERLLARFRKIASPAGIANVSGT
jgi:apolipoprotein N-acyltransferase